MRRILVTGGTGFIGRLCVERLRGAGHHVISVSSKERSAERGISWRQADLLDGATVARLLSEVEPTELLHLGWCTQHGQFWEAPENLLWLEASLRLLREFQRCGGKRVVVAGSCAEYDWRFGFCSEGITPLAPSSLYGVCKRALQTVLEAYWSRSGLSWAWGRLFWLYGPGEQRGRLVPYVIESLLNGRSAVCRNLSVARDFLYVEDAADAFCKLLESDLQGAVNIASGRPLTIRDLVLEIAGAVGVVDGLDAYVEEPGAPETPLVVADIRRAREELRWQPETSLSSGLRRTALWWRDRRQDGARAIS